VATVCLFLIQVRHSQRTVDLCFDGFRALAQTKREGSPDTAAISAAVTSYEACDERNPTTDAARRALRREGRPCSCRPSPTRLIGQGRSTCARHMLQARRSALHVKFIIAEVFQMARMGVRTHQFGPEP